jgi:hypothetical protein
MPAKPPHILPAGFVAEADPAGVADDEGTAGGGGPELTTPEGVSCGRLLAVGVVVGGTVDVELPTVGVGAPAVGLGGEEQLTSAPNNRNATHTCDCFGLLMPST